MKKKTWAKKIKDACKEAGTYRPFFENSINTLAEILEKRDEAEEFYKESGGKPIVEYTNKNGSTNMVKNPALVVWDDMNKSALNYWRDLGLTPAGLKKIDDTALQKKESNPFAQMLAGLQ
ncbi:MAG: P27 family phage terminase small subunit [Lachnospiraceae bacterium]|nr:P27 family phage terminase small subunit [Lachnospiraceae bacterium]